MHTFTPVPKVMIIIDTAILGGPGKGLLQFLRHETSERYSYILCGFEYRNPRSTQFIDMAREAGCNLRLLPQRFRFDPSALQVALQIARSERINIVQSHGYKAHIVALAIRRRLGTPWLAMTHGWTREDWKILLYNCLERSLLKRADVAATVSPPLFREVQLLRGPDRPTRLILNAVDPEEFSGPESGASVRARYGIPSDSKVIGVFGRLSPEKGVLNGVKAFEKACKRFDKARLLIVGDGQLFNQLDTLIKELKLEDRVVRAGYHADMRGFYDATDLLMIPSLSEGLPNVLLEAMALGIPALCTNVGAISEVINDGQNGWLVEPGNVDALASRIQEVLADQTALQVMGSVAQSSIYPQFAPERRAKQFVAVYDELLLPRRIRSVQTAAQEGA